MADFLSHLLDNAFGQASVLERRRSSMFEAPTPDLTLGTDASLIEGARPERTAALQAPASPLALPIISEVRAPVPAAIAAPLAETSTPVPAIAVPAQPQRIESTRIVEREPAAATVTLDRTREIQTIVERRVETISPGAPLAPAAYPVQAPLETPRPPVRESAPPAVVRIESRTIVVPAPVPAPSTIAARTAALPVPVSLKAATPRQELARHETRAAEAPAPIHVSIGRIEVRAAQPAATPARKARSFTPKLSLDDYLQSRYGGSK